MTISLTTMSKKGAKLSIQDIDTNWMEIQTALNTTMETLAGVIVKLQTLQQSVDILTKKFPQIENGLASITSATETNATQLNQLSGQVNTLAHITSTSQLTTIQTQLNDLSATVTKVSIDLSSKVPMTVFNTQIASINSNLLK